jgi:hypothetical protein
MGLKGSHRAQAAEAGQITASAGLQKQGFRPIAGGVSGHRISSVGVGQLSEAAVAPAACIRFRLGYIFWGRIDLQWEGLAVTPLIQL